MGVADYLFSQLKAINSDRQAHIQKINNKSAEQYQDIIIKNVIREQFEGYKNNITKPNIFNLIDNFVKDHVNNDSKHIEYFSNSQEPAKLYFLGLANLTLPESEN